MQAVADINVFLLLKLQSKS